MHIKNISFKSHFVTLKSFKDILHIRIASECDGAF